MEAFLQSFAISAAVAVLMSALVQSLLPESGIKKYVKVVLGIVVTIVLLSPLAALLSDIDPETEAKRAIDSMGSVNAYKYDPAQYKDYIYEVYMDDQ